MAHSCLGDPELLCRECEQDELFAEVVRAERELERQGKCGTCDEPLRADGGCQLCDQERAKEIPFAIGGLLTILLLCFPVFGQSVFSGRGVSSGFSSIGHAQQGGGFVPALPAIWVDNNEALDGANCGGQCSGQGFVAPAYELTLPNTWVSGPPSGCTFHLPYWTGTPSAATAGAALQLAITDIQVCRDQHNSAVILNVPVLAGIGYSTTNGITIDSTASSLPTQLSVIRSTADSTLAAMPEPVCAGGIQDNVAAATAPGVINSDCAGDHVAYQLGMTVYCADGTPATGNNPQNCTYTGAFTLANGAATNTSAYNYAQYMPQITCTANACIPLAFCNADGNANIPCSSTTVSAGFWAIYDLAIGPCPANSGCAGANNDQFIISVGNGQRATDASLFNRHFHFRRIWVHGDWTDLSHGENSIATAFAISSGDYWSIVGSQMSQALRPGGEGHAVSVQGRSGKIVNNVFDGQGSGIFAGGESTSRTIAGYIANTDMEIGRNRETFPLSWLGSMCSGTNPTNGGNACGNIPDTNYYWGGAGANHVNTPSCTSGPSEPGVVCVDVSSDGLTVSVHGGSWPAGMPPFHDSSTVWDVGHQPVYINNSANKCGDGTQTCKINTMGSGTCTAWPASTGCPTSLTLQAAVVGAPLTNVPFASFVNSIVRKNCHEFKEGARIAYYGNICENVDNSGGQNGINFANAIRSISGNPTGRNYYADLHDVTVQGSIFRNSCNGFTNAGGRSAGSGNGSGVSWSMRNMSFTDILGYNISGTNPGCGPSDFGIRTSSALQQWTVAITENHGNGTSGDHATATATCPTGECAIGYEAFNILAGEPVFITNTGSGCSAFIQPAPQTTGAGIGPLANAGSARWEDANRSALVTGASYNSGTNVGTITSTLNPGIGSVSINGVNPGNTGNAGWNGDWTVTSSSGSQFTIDMSGAGTPAAYISGGVAQQILAGTYPWPTLSVTYPWVAPSDTVDSTGACQLTNQQGEPAGVTWNHLTFVTDASSPLGSDPTPAKGAPYLRNISVVNNIILGGGWYNQSVANPKEGAHTESFDYDVTSMSAHHLVWPGRSAYASQYVEYGNNSSFPDSSGCTGAGCSNVPNMYFPAATCSGFGFNFSCSSVPLFRNDYHDFAQASGGAFHNAASDGTDMGARIPIIDSMMTVNKYTCGTSCGSPGPFTQ